MMASRQKSGASPSVIRRRHGIPKALIFTVIALATIALAAWLWLSTGDDPRRVPAAQPGDAEDQPLPQKLPEAAKQALPAPAPPKQEAGQRRAAAAPAEVATKAQPLSPPPRPVKREAAAAPKRNLAELSEAAKAGEAEAQYQLGRAHLAGGGAKTDPIEAVAWFILAAARDHVLARQERDKHLAAFKRDDRISAAKRANAFGPIIPAGWAEDPASGTRVWLPGWFRNGVYKLELKVAATEGLAEGVRLYATPRLGCRRGPAPCDGNRHLLPSGS